MTNENCIFCKIVAGQIPSYKVYEDQNFLGFLTIRPHTKGHMLLVPKEHYSDINELPAEIFQSLFNTGKKIADKIKIILNPKRVSLMTMGLEVDHTHLHILPVNEAHDLDSNKAYEISKEEVDEVLELYRF